MKQIGFNEYKLLRLNPKDILNNSGTIREKTLIFKTKELGIREAHIFSEAMVEGAMLMVGLEEVYIM